MTTAPHAVDVSLRPGPAQLRLAALAAPACARYGLALAGGHALRAHGVAACPQDGLTLATGGADLPEVAAALAEAYRAAGGGVAERPGTPRLEQLTVRLALGGRTRWNCGRNRSATGRSGSTWAPRRRTSRRWCYRWSRWRTRRRSPPRCWSTGACRVT
ncbi:hypothetical protein ACWC9T_19935 [Kitasatospora sp. NPDC001159]